MWRGGEGGWGGGVGRVGVSELSTLDVLKLLPHLTISIHAAGSLIDSVDLVTS